MIEENYQIEEMVEQAPFFVIYSALNKQSGDKCLIKRYVVDDSSEIGQIDGWREKFSDLLLQFQHVNIPSVRTIVDGGLDPYDGKACTIFEWLEVNPLSALLTEHASLGVESFTQMAQAILEGLIELHAKGVLQAKLTPETIHFTDTAGKSPWVITWDPIRALRCKHGVNRFENDGYTAPEIIAGSGEVSIQSDLYSLGKILERVAAEFAEDPELLAWHSQLVAADPQQRFTSAQDALDALLISATPQEGVAAVGATSTPVAFAGFPDELLDDDAEVAPVSTPVVHVPEKGKPPVLILAIAAILIIGVGVYFLTQTKDEEGFKILSEEEIAEIAASHGNEKKLKAKKQKEAAKRELTKAKKATQDIGGNSPKVSGKQVVLKWDDVAKAKEHQGETVKLKGRFKEVILASGGNLYVLTCTPAKARRNTVCATASPSSFYPELSLQELRKHLLGKKMVATGPLKKNPSSFSIHLADNDAVQFVNEQ